MKKILTLLFFTAWFLQAGAQKESFDLATYTPLKGWKKEKRDELIQFTKEDEAKGTYCAITLYKAVDASEDAKANFDLSWEALVKETLGVNTAPEMQEPAKENGWEVQSGYTQFENDGNKGIALLVASTGNSKVVNILILTNTDAYEPEITKFLESVDLKKMVVPGTNQPKTTTQNNTVTQTQPAIKSKFAFNTTNFDDGWTATEQEDWVEVVKGSSKVLIHYPRNGTIFPADPEPLTVAAWNILVAPKYSNLKNFKTTYISTYNRPYLGFGTATDNASGKEVYIVLYRQGETGWLEFVTPDKSSFIQEFKFDPDAIRWDSETDLLKPLEKMSGYNKFAIAASDFTGTWTSDFTGVQQLYNVYTGSYAGMNLHQSSREFVFGAGGSYSWKLLAVNGMVGDTKYVEVKSSGKFSVLNNWQLKFSKIESGPATYHAFWSCIKGARLLKLLDANSPGSGIYDVYGKK
jgi:hypothetical protein